MTMHLEKPYLTTTNTKKRKEKITRAKQEELEQTWRDRNKKLKQSGIPAETFEQFLDWIYGRGKKEKTQEKNRSIGTISAAQASQKDKMDQFVMRSSKEESNTKAVSEYNKWIKGAITTKQTPTYTGTKIKGIGVMHKSNLVPIFSDDEAVDIAHMRR